MSFESGGISSYDPYLSTQPLKEKKLSSPDSIIEYFVR